MQVLEIQVKGPGSRGQLYHSKAHVLISNPVPQSLVGSFYLGNVGIN